MDNMYTKIGLAIFSFFLGLVATYISSVWKIEEKSITYSLSSTPIISIANANKYVAQYYTKDVKNISKYNIIIVNNSDKQVEKFNFLIFPETKVVMQDIKIKTFPERGVTYKKIIENNELKLVDITLDLNQKLLIEFMAVSKDTPIIKTFINGGGGGVKWYKVDNIDNNNEYKKEIINLLKLLVMLIIIPGIILLIYKIYIAFFMVNHKNKTTLIIFEIFSKVSFYIIISMMFPPIVYLVSNFSDDFYLRDTTYITTGSASNIIYNTSKSNLNARQEINTAVKDKDKNAKPEIN